MTQLLYIGNNLRNEQSNRSVMDTLGPLLEQEGYDVSYASSKSHKLMRLLDMLKSVLKYRNSVDVVLIDTYSTQNFYYAFFVSQLCRLLKLPYMPILHGGNLPERLKSSPNMSQLIFTHASCNICPSLYLKTAFEAEGYRNLIYIPNPIDIHQYPAVKRDFAAPKLLWVRSLSAIYNPFMAIHVLNDLQRKGVAAELCMVGPDTEGLMESLKALAKALGVTVTFTGKLSKPEWIALSKAYNVFINTTTIDNAPVSVIEAMALGLPVVSTNVGGMPYLIAHGTHGLLVPSDAVEAMVAAVISLFEQPEKRNQMIMNARALAETFDWEKVKFRWEEVLKG